MRCIFARISRREIESDLDVRTPSRDPLGPHPVLHRYGGTCGVKNSGSKAPDIGTQSGTKRGVKAARRLGRSIRNSVSDEGAKPRTNPSSGAAENSDNCTSDVAFRLWATAEAKVRGASSAQLGFPSCRWITRLSERCMFAINGSSNLLGYRGRTSIIMSYPVK